MKDEIVAKLFGAVRDVVEAFGDQAFADFGEIENADTRARMRTLRREYKYVKDSIPKYPKPFRAVFALHDRQWTKDFKNEKDAEWAVCNHYEKNPTFGNTSAHYYDRRALWK